MERILLPASKLPPTESYLINKFWEIKLSRQFDAYCNRFLFDLFMDAKIANNAIYK